MTTGSSYSSMHIVLIILSYILVFIVGLYMNQSTVYIRLPSKSTENVAELTENMTTDLQNNSTTGSFYDIGMKHGTDKVTVHRYHTLYEKHIRRYIGSDVVLLEIGLGCDSSYGPGRSAYLWREYLGPRAILHFLEYNVNCAKQWWNDHGKKVKSLQCQYLIFFSRIVGYNDALWESRRCCIFEYSQFQTRLFRYYRR